MLDEEGVKATYKVETKGVQVTLTLELDQDTVETLSTVSYPEGTELVLTAQTFFNEIVEAYNDASEER